jgi:hypothetical protein
MNPGWGFMSMSWTYADLKRKALGAIIAGSLLAVMIGLARNKWANDASPIRSVDLIDATIKSVYWDRTKIYALFLDDNSLVLVRDDRPHLIGSHVSLERVTRDNGSIFYRFAS